MTQGVPIPIPNLPDAFVDEVHKHIRLYSVSLVVEPQSKDPWSCAGTLCEVGGTKGILTARHAWDELRRHSALVLAGKAHVHLERGFVTAVVPNSPLAPIPGGAEVPDIAFVQLSAAHCASLEDFGKVFYSLDKHSAYEAAAIGDDGYYVMYGAPQELMRAEVKAASSFLYGTAIRRTFEANGWDFIEVALDLPSNRSIPEALNGVSGGGVWRVRWKEEEGERIQVPDRYRDICLIGVNFYQTAELSDSVVIAHGPRSIYEGVPGEVRTQRA